MSKKQRKQRKPEHIHGDPALVLTILQERGNTDPYIREIIRSAILEAALIQARQDTATSDEDT